MKIHPTAIIDSAAELASSVEVGPYTIIESGVKIGADTVIGSHTLISGPTTVGEGNNIGSFCNIGAPPQDIRYNGEPTELVIGDRNLIREYVSLHRGTVGGRGVTTIGSNNMMMAYVHVAHDCIVEDHVIMANAATLGGHVVVENRVTIGGMVGVHQFSKIGCYAFIGGMSGISKDVPPYIVVSGVRNLMRVSGINKIGLKRCGFSAEVIRQLGNAFMVIFKTPELLLHEALDKAEAEFSDSQEVMHMITFIRSTKRSVTRTSNGDE
ncbi:MAG: acyl-ACP--UDP-N-acetylglucosamine O-acyltransferase [Proteobacteria bacterium]|nr:acyl-ACP--UDP-N-acetylglucosamine O-acyltransferase [Pseudomonadota bacterium]MBU1714148.1 acyl-ACP--UDP-N-acetylglucosamine O-acyltransferase [Pseudomonadota bacterium]